MRRVPLAIDVIIILCAVWFFALGWLVLALLVTWVEPFTTLYQALSALWLSLAELVGRLGASLGLAGSLLGIALQGLFAAGLGLLLIGGWGMLPVWSLISIGLLGERLDRRAAARRDAEEPALDDPRATPQA